MSNIVAIVGRPNVGKSTLFNRLTESRQAIVDQTSGVTRDRQYGKSDWNGKYFSIIDTGGYVMGGDDEFEIEIRKQVQLAVDEADIILFLVDAREGMTPMDEDVASMLRKCTKKVLLVANKVDNAKERTTWLSSTPSVLATPTPLPASAEAAPATCSTLLSRTSAKASPTKPTPCRVSPLSAVQT